MRAADVHSDSAISARRFVGLGQRGYPNAGAVMGLSKSSRILILLAIDSAFFLLELVVGE